VCRLPPLSVHFMQEQAMASSSRAPPFSRIATLLPCSCLSCTQEYAATLKHSLDGHVHALCVWVRGSGCGGPAGTSFHRPPLLPNDKDATDVERFVLSTHSLHTHTAWPRPMGHANALAKTPLFLILSPPPFHPSTGKTKQQGATA